MLSKGKKQFPKASHLGVHIIYTLHVFAKTQWFFVWFLNISTTSLRFYVCICIYIYIYILNLGPIKHKYNHLTREERKGMYDLRNDTSIIINKAYKGSVVVIWDKGDYLKETYR